MSKEKYGFVYIWYNRVKKKFYIGCHWGTEDDGYICSSDLMRKAYRRNPEYFKRRVVSRVYTNRQELLEEEHKWLALIPDEELGKRYYNLSKKHFGHWTATPDARAVSDKLKDAWEIRKTKWQNGISEQTRNKISKSTSGSNNHYYGRKHSNEIKKKLSESHKGNVCLEITKLAVSQKHKGSFWITDGIKDKRIKGNIPDGWRKGRTAKVGRKR